MREVEQSKNKARAKDSYEEMIAMAKSMATPKHMLLDLLSACPVEVASNPNISFELRAAFKAQARVWEKRCIETEVTKSQREWFESGSWVVPELDMTDDDSDPWVRPIGHALSAMAKPDLWQAWTTNPALSLYAIENPASYEECMSVAMSVSAAMVESRSLDNSEWLDVQRTAWKALREDSWESTYAKPAGKGGGDDLAYRAMGTKPLAKPQVGTKDGREVIIEHSRASLSTILNRSWAQPQFAGLLGRRSIRNGKRDSLFGKYGLRRVARSYLNMHLLVEELKARGVFVQHALCDNLIVFAKRECQWPS